MTHPCPGCGKHVRNALFACKPCWFRLPREIRGRIWSAHNGDLASYGLAAGEARRWYAESPAVTP